MVLGNLARDQRISSLNGNQAGPPLHQRLAALVFLSTCLNSQLSKHGVPISSLRFPRELVECFGLIAWLYQEYSQNNRKHNYCSYPFAIFIHFLPQPDNCATPSSGTCSRSLLAVPCTAALNSLSWNQATSRMSCAPRGRCA